VHINVSASYEQYVIVETEDTCCEHDINSLSFIKDQFSYKRHNTIFDKKHILISRRYQLHPVSATKSENGSNITGPNGLVSAAGLFNLGSSGLAMKMVRCSLVP
jgi:hypothetical protein